MLCTHAPHFSAEFLTFFYRDFFYMNFYCYYFKILHKVFNYHTLLRLEKGWKIVGFFYFLKKKETLCLPPAPPAGIEEENLEFPELPELPSFELKKKPATSSPIIPKILPPPSLLSEREMEEIKKARPIYVNISDYKKSIDAVNDARKILNETEAHILKIGEIESQKQKANAKYQDRVEDIQRKLIFLDKTIFEK